MSCNQDKQKAHKHGLFVVFNSCFRRLSCVLIFLCVFPLSLSFSSACPQGTFKSFQGAGLCQQCPLNSRSTIEAATLCGCRNGYYRGDMDKPEDVCTSESQTNTKKISVVDIADSPISHHWIKGQYLLWFIIPTLISCTLFRASAPQCSRPCLGIWGAVSNNTATLLRLSIEVNMCLACRRGYIAMQDEAQSLKNAACSVPQRDGVSRLRHESFWTVSVASLKLWNCVYMSVCVCTRPGDLDTT